MPYNFKLLQNSMEIKPLVFKNYDYIKWNDIKKKYREEYNLNPVKLTETELKSILAVLFSIRYHYPVIEEHQKVEVDVILTGSIPISSTTSKFGLVLLENLDNDNQNWFNFLKGKSYLLSKIFSDFELNEFIRLAMIDYMAIRKFEYGKFFLSEYSKSIIDTSDYFFESRAERVKRTLDITSNKLEFVANKILKENTVMSSKDLLIMSFTFNEYFSKSSNKDVVYAITNYIVRDNFFELIVKKKIFKEKINKTLGTNWNLNRGRGGHKR